MSFIHVRAMSLNLQGNTHMSVIQKDQGLGNVVQSEDAMRGRPKPIKLTKVDEKKHYHCSGK